MSHPSLFEGPEVPPWHPWHYKCPHCLVGPGHPCRTPLMRKAPMIHAERMAVLPMQHWAERRKWEVNSRGRNVGP